MSIEVGLSTFAETTRNPKDGTTISAAQRLQEVVQEAVLAEEVGLDVYAVGEHHRRDFAVSSPAVVLAAVAARTERIRLSSAVSVLSSDDPVRVYQQFATVDLLSGGRAEIMAGRGSFTESFPLFGQDLEDYDELFAEKLELLLAIRRDEYVTWTGTHRTPLAHAPVYPRAQQEPLPVWVAVGGSPESVMRAGRLGLPLVLAIIGGDPSRFVPFARGYRRALEAAGHPPQPLGVHLHGFVADTTEEAVDAFFGPYAVAMTQIGRERGWPPMSRAAFDQMRAPEGSLALGTPDEVAAKLIRVQAQLGADRVMLHPSVGTIGHARVRRAIELLGAEVAPALRAAARSGVSA